MTITTLSNVRIAGIACAIPERVRELNEVAEAFGENDARKISENTGVHRSHITSLEVCASDLCYAAAANLLTDLKWDTGTVDVLVLVTQTPDYILPATSCSLHNRLGLSKSCAAFDLNLGCSGYIYGLWVTMQLLAAGQLKRALLLVGDTISKLTSPHDRSVAPLFGDAGTATALEYDIGAPTTTFVLGTDGKGEKHLIVPAGGFRQPHSSTSSVRTERENGNIRSDEDLYMNGTEIFTFTLREVPSLIGTVLQEAGWEKDTVDAFVFHQANRFMLEYLIKRMKIPPQKVPLDMEEYGNTSSASIPLAIVDYLADNLKAGMLKIVLAGFGVGFSWGAVALSCGPLVISDTALV